MEQIYVICFSYKANADVRVSTKMYNVAFHILLYDTMIKAIFLARCLILKVTYFKIEFMNSLFLPKYKQKNCRDSCPH